ncbi:septation protein SepH [Rothia endophytica]|uniref:septation protein SepH n=1 Tax=Rothia endophytica TaxID=1324766 RepID=UPI001EEDB8B4|nr:septation protein SepH [Rothia endophytica]
MLELQLAGIHDDGENLVLNDDNGSSYLLPIDQNLRQSIAKARRISPTRPGGRGSFGPRDIQARFRQGATVEEIAAESGWEAERVRRYEWPIVAERANIIRTARSVLISPTPGGEGPARSLDQHYEAISQHYSFGDAPLDWSTWQQESGQWTLALDVELPTDVQNELPRGVHFPARWTFNPANQSLYASNEAAYFLMGREHTTGGPIPGLGTNGTSHSAEAEQKTTAENETALTPEPASSPRLTAVRVPENREQNALLDELTARRGARSFDPASERKLADLLERARRTSRPLEEAHAEVPAVSSEAEGSSATEQPDSSLSEQPVINSEAEAPAQEAQETAPVAEFEAAEGQEAEVQEGTAEVHEAAETGGIDERAAGETASDSGATAEQVDAAEPSETESTDAQADSHGEQGEEETAAQEPVETEPAQPKPASRGKRTSVPSWDDIIFGNQRR